MKQLHKMLGLLLLMLGMTLTTTAGDNDLLWDYTEAAPSANPDNGLYYASAVNDAAGTNNGLKGIKLNSSGYAFFAKAAVAGKLTLTIGDRKKQGAYAVNVYACTIADGKATKGSLIGEVSVDDPGAGSIDIGADVTGIYIERKTTSEGVLSKIVFKEKVARNFVNFEITNSQLSGKFDDATLPAGITFSGTERNDEHGYGNVTIKVPVDGTVRFTIGGCQYANRTFTVTNSAGETLATLDPKTATCYHQDGASITYLYTGAADELTFNNIQYLPYFKAEATEVTEAVITYKDQNGRTLGTKTVYEGDAIGEVPYTEADLTIESGYKFRGWIYSNNVKVNPTDVVNGSTTVKASVTAIESATVGSVLNYDLTQATFYPEDHETFDVNGGKWYNNQHGFVFGAGNSFTIDVAGKAQVVLSRCMYSNEAAITVTDGAGNTISDDVSAKADNDGGLATVQYDGPATKLTFTFASTAYLHKVTVYNVTDFLTKDTETGYYIIPTADAASLLLALNTASAEQGSKIFLPDGTYDLGKTVLTTVSGKNLSIIGQSAEKTIIVTAPPVSMEGLGSADLLVNSGEGLYLQDITLKNALDYYNAGSTGRAPSLHDQGTKTICKNVRMLSYQDTYYSHKVGGLFYFEGGELHGTVDYLCGNGKVYFNNVTLFNEKYAEATMTANSELYVFNDCTVKGVSDKFNFGRAWSNDPVCIYLNTTLTEPNKLVGTRWKLTGINCDYSIAGEYGTKDAQGKDITPESNNVTFTKANTALNTILTAEALDTYAIDKVLGSWAATAQDEAKQVEISDVTSTDTQVSWTLPANGSGVLMLCALDVEGNESIVKIGALGNSITTAELQAANAAGFTIRAANQRGGFGPAVLIYGENTAITSPKAKTTTDQGAVYNLQGVRVLHPTHGLYIVNGKKMIFK